MLKIIGMILQLGISVGLIIAVLMQMTQKSQLGGAFGSGASYTVFGASKKLDTLGKITLALAIAFMISSIFTAYLIVA